MIKNDSKCFIITKDGEYEEITYEELKIRKQLFEEYQYKHFIALHNMLLEVTKKDYQDFYKEFERYRYYEKLEKHFNILSIEKVLFEGKDIFKDNKDFFYDEERKEDIERIRKALYNLDYDEYKLIKALFFDGKTVREYAKKIGIPKSTVENRKKSIMKKMKNFL